MALALVRKAIGLFLTTPPAIVRAGSPLLKARCTADVNPTHLESQKLKKIVEKMTLAFTSNLTPVMGLSAPQIGDLERIIAFEIKDKKTLRDRGLEKPVPLTFLVNPKIISRFGEEIIEREWCESIPLYSALVKRQQSIHVTALDLEGNKVDRKYSGLLARIIQHEIDHLDGVCFVDKMEKKSLLHDSLA